MPAPARRRQTPQRRRPTLAEVARLAGVSATAVSLVVNDRAAGEVSEETRQRVLEAVATLGYRPNRAARGLRTRRSQTIGFVTDEIAVGPASGRTISGAHDVARSHGWMMYMVNTTRDPRALRAAIDDLLDRQVDAILFAVASSRRAAPPPEVSQVPTILVNCFPPGAGPPCVLPAEAAGGRAATDLVLAAGHRRIAYVAGMAGSWGTRQRLKGHRQALDRAGVPYDAALVSYGDFRTESGYALTRALLGRRDRPTAILCGSDRMAVGAYLALSEAGLRVPHDMSVVGYDDQEELAADVHPALSTVHLPYYEMGTWAVQQLVAGAVAELPARTYCPCRVVSRSSVAAPALRGALRSFATR
jgi:LacI family transcriptional regulator